MKIGFIGVGNIGAPIAGQLLAAGHTLVVHDLRRAAATALIDGGAQWAASPAVLAAACEVVATCLPGPAEMEAVCLGADGIVTHLKPGALYIDHTTNAPLLVRRVHAMLAAREVAMLDAPVSGGMEGARTRDLLVKAGIDAATIVHVFNEAALGHQMSLKVRLPATYLRGDFDPRFSLALAKKDLGLALDLARATETPMRFAALCEQELIEAIGRGWADRDASIALTLQEERAGATVRLPPD